MPTSERDYCTLHTPPFSHPASLSPSPTRSRITAHVQVRRVGVRATLRTVSSLPLDHSFEPFIFPGYVYANESLSRNMSARTGCSSKADLIFPFMTHCPREQLAPHAWIAYKPRIYDASKESNGAGLYNLCLESKYIPFYIHVKK